MLEEVLFTQGTKKLLSFWKWGSITSTLPFLPWLPGSSEVTMKFNHCNSVDTYGWITSMFSSKSWFFFLPGTELYVCILNCLKSYIKWRRISTDAYSGRCHIVQPCTHTWSLWMGKLRLDFRFPIHSHPPKITPASFYLNGKVVSKVAPHSPVSDPLWPPATFHGTKHSVEKE